MKPFQLPLSAILLAAASPLCSHIAAAQPAAVVRLSSAPKIDGDGADWAGVQAQQRIMGRLGAVGSFKLGYDDANFFALITVKDPTPLKNGSTIFQELLKGGDAIGLSFGPTTPGSITYQRIMLARLGDKDEIVAMRPHWTDKSHAYTYFTAAGGTVPMDFVGRLTAEGAQVALAPAPGGYNAEVKIPWSALAVNPTAGLKLPFDVQIIYSDPAGTTNVDTSWWHSTGGGPYSTTDMATEARLYPEVWGEAQFFATDPGPQQQISAAAQDPVLVPGGLPVSFTLPRDSHVSVIIRDKTGWIVRELVRARAFKAGPHTLYWDGRDRWGAIEPAGQYSYRVGYFDGLKTSFAASAGNSAFPPYRTADGLGSAGGMHGGPQAVGAGDGGTMYLLNGGEEGQPSLRKIDIATGKSLWFHSVGGFGMGEAMAADADSSYMIYASNSVTSLVRMDPKTGKNLPIGPRPDPIQLGNVTVHGLVVLDGNAYFSVPKENRIGVLNLKTAAVGADIPVEGVQGIAAGPDGQLLVCQKDEVRLLDPKTGQQKPLIGGLQAAAAVTRDSDGNIYVSDLGSSQQIKQFDATGKPLTAFGVPGGRGLQAVPYNPMAFRNVTDLTVGSDHNLWFVEQFQAPRRVGHLSLDGKFLLNDIYGPARCGDNVGFDLDDPTSLWFEARPDGQGQYINAKVDYAAYAQSPDGSKGFKVDSIWRLSQGGGETVVTPDLMLDRNGAALGAYSRQAVFTATNGKRYFWLTNGTRCGIFLWENNNWKAVAAVGGDANNVHYWADKNGDGLVQDEETSKAPVDSSWHWMGRDLTVYGINGALKPASVDARGVPSYEGGQFTTYLQGSFPSLWNYYDVQAYSAQMAPGSSENSVYFSGNNGPHQNRDFWDRTSENRIVKIKDGRIQWMVGNHDGTLAHNGDQIIGFGVAGEVDGVVLASDVGGNFVGYTDDGLALGWAITNDQGRPAEVGPNAIYVENAAPGEFIKDPKTGKRLLLTHTSEDVRVLDVSGVFGKDITRIDGNLTLGTPLPRAGEAKGRVTAVPYSTWQKSIYEVWRATNVDAYDYEWGLDAVALPIKDSAGQRGEIRLRRDAGNLCVYADVLEEKPFQGPGQSALSGDNKTDAAALFGHGDGVELLLGSATANSKRDKAAAGDTRFFLTGYRNQDGQLVGRVLACKPASAPVPPSPELSEQSSEGKYRDAGTKTALDLSTGLVNVPGALIKVRERFDRQGYVIEAEIPLAIMPELTRQQSLTFYHAGGGDQGILTRATRSDLLPVRLNAAIWQAAAPGASPASAARRLAWQPDGVAGSDPKVMNPGAWGLAAEPLSISLSLAAASSKPAELTYLTSQSSVFSFGGGPTVTVPAAIYGGGWFFENGLHFLTSPPREGFAMTLDAEGEPGAGQPNDGNNRSVRLDMRALGISNHDARPQRAFGPTKPTSVTVKADFPAAQSGKMHVLWGTYTDNSTGIGELKVTDLASEKVIDAAKNPGLALAVGFNQNFEARESIFAISGNRSLAVDVTDKSGGPRTYLMGLWIEPDVQTNFAAGSNINLAAYTGSTTGKITAVEFYAGAEKIGAAASAPYAIQWTPTKPGTYRITAKVTDELGASGTSEVVVARVSP